MQDVTTAPEADPLARALASVIRSVRHERSLSVSALARLSAVSRATIANIERAEVQPTAALLGRLSGALGLTLSQLVARAEGDQDRYRPHSMQPVWTDPESGYVRRAVTPAGSPVEIVEVRLPAGAEISFVRESYFRPHVIWVLEGRLDLLEDGRVHALGVGDSLTLGPPSPCTYRNPTRSPTRYAVVLGQRV